MERVSVEQAAGRSGRRSLSRGAACPKLAMLEAGEAEVALESKHHRRIALARHQ